MGTGKARRLRRLFPDGPGLWLPVDDSLISGPTAGLEDICRLLDQAGGQVDAVLAFRGTLVRCSSALVSTATVENLTASSMQVQHTRKSVVASVEGAIAPRRRRGGRPPELHR